METNSTYKQRKEKGLCVKCGKRPPISGKVQCQICTDKDRAYHKEARAYFLSIGLCSRCGKNKLFGEEKECPECLAKLYENNIRSRERRGIDSKEQYKKDIQMLKEKGLCRSCRKQKAAEGHTYCRTCLEKTRERSRKYRMKKEKIGIYRSERPNYGLCYTCGNPLDRDGRICQRCSENVTKNLPVMRDNKFWRQQNRLLSKAHSNIEMR